MEYFENEKNARDYIKMCEGYDGKELIELLRQHLPDQSTLLELGIGPGTDFEILKKHYRMTGSDFSSTFLKLYQEKDPEANLIQLDAVTLETEQLFDGIYSNKVLHHLSREDLKTSLANQYYRLNENGILLHSFWHGDKEETHQGMRFIYYTEEQLSKLFQPQFTILHMERYSEMDEQDSVVLIAKRNQ